jgi:hypothetical protein
MDWKQLSDGRWWIAAMDDASRLILGYEVFQEATAENTIQVLKDNKETATQRREDRNSRIPGEIIMGNHTVLRLPTGLDSLDCGISTSCVLSVSVIGFPERLRSVTIP